MAPLFDSQTLLTYLLAAFALVLAPGPGQALVVSRTVQSGARAGFLTCVGLEIGTLVHTFAAALGLSAILATSASTYAAVKYAGAIYLVVLGWLALRRSGSAAGSGAMTTAAGAPEARGWRLVVHGAMAGTLNPKVAVFFLAFLPQFVHPEHGRTLLQFMVLGLLLATMGLLWDSVVTFATARARQRLVGSPRFAAWRDRLTGAVMIALGLRLAFADRK